MENPAFSSGMNFGFSLGNMDFSNTNFQMGNQAQKPNKKGMNNNKENKRPQKKGKSFPKSQNKPTDYIVENQTDPNVQNLQNNQEDGEQPNSPFLSKASKKIKKETINKLKKNARNNHGFNDSKGMNRRPKNSKNFVPGKGK